MARDPWVRRLGITLLITLVIAGALYAGLRFALLSQSTDVQAIAR